MYLRLGSIGGTAASQDMCLCAKSLDWKVINSGKTVALVGGSGSGKSTTIQARNWQILNQFTLMYTRISNFEFLQMV